MDDLLIVGGGPTGLAAALYAAQAGLAVRILEKQPSAIGSGTGSVIGSAIDKACGEGLMPGGVAELISLGIHIERKRVFQGIRYIDGKHCADGHFSNGDGWGIRRTVLHQAMQQKVLSLGIPIEEHCLRHIRQSADRVTADGFSARYLLGADGLNSSVRRLCGINVSRPTPRRYGLRQHFALKPWSNFVEVHWSPLAEAYVTPVDDELVGVAILFGDALRQQLAGHSGKMYQRALALFPALQSRCIEPASQIRGAGPFKTLVSHRVAGRVVLVGDAAGYLDPLTGEGLRLGFRSARMAIEAISTDSLQHYDQRWYRATRRYWWSTSALLALRRREMLRKMILPTLNAVPGLFDFILDQLEAG